MTTVKTRTNRPAADARVGPAAKATPARAAKTASAARVATPAPAEAAEVAETAETADAAVAAEDGPARPKPKLVRDSFTIPKSEYAVLDALKLRATRLMRPTKKSEVLRAGIAALNAMNDKAFLAAINGVPSLKTGRPKATPPAKPPTR